MKILVVADLHYALPQFDWLVQAAVGYDLVILAGDMLDTSSSVDPGTQTVVVLKYLKRLADIAPLIVCSGNHDLDAVNVLGEKEAGWLERARRHDVRTDGETIEAGGVLISICAWWDGPKARDAIGAQLARDAEKHADHWFWVYHAPPPDSPVSWSGQRHFGDSALAGWIGQYAPDCVFSGHVHEAPFTRSGSWVDKIGPSWVFNAGRQYGPMPTSISIDTEQGVAAWFSVEGAEAVELAQPLVRPLPQLTAMPDWLPGRVGPV